MAQSSYQYIYSQMSLYKGVEGGAEGGVENSRFQLLLLLLLLSSQPCQS